MGLLVLFYRVWEHYNWLHVGNGLLSSISQIGSKEQANAKQEAFDGCVDLDIRIVKNVVVSWELLT
jgi:hypothetical protein